MLELPSCGRYCFKSKAAIQTDLTRIVSKFYFEDGLGQEKRCPKTMLSWRGCLRFLSQLFKRGPVPLPLANHQTAGASRPPARPPSPDSTRTSMLASAIERPRAATMSKSPTNHDTFLFMIKKREGKKKDKKSGRRRRKKKKKKKRRKKKRNPN